MKPSWKTPDVRRMDPGRGLYLDRFEWEALPAKLEDPFFQRLHENNLRALAALRSEQNGGDPCDVPLWLGWPHPRRRSHRVLKNRILRRIAAWWITRETIHLEDIEVLLEHLCQHREIWLPGDNTYSIRGANLATGELLHLVAFALDALGEHLPPELRESCLAALRDIGLAAYERGHELGDWWRRCNFNWNSALHGNAGIAALALRTADPATANRMLGRALEGLSYLLAAFPEDGGWTEGIMYSDTMIAHLTDFVIPLHRLCGEDLGLRGNPAFHRILDWQRHFIAPDGRPLNFSNCNEFTQERCLAHGYYWARVLDRPELAAFQERMERDWRYTAGLFFDVEAFWMRTAFQPARETPLDRRRHFKALDWVAWRGRSSWLAFRSGFNGGNHNNLDLGHFILGRDACRYLCDPGYGASETAQHNAVTFRRKNQADATTAHITHFEEREDGGFELDCDLAACFPGPVEKYTRHLRMLGEDHLLVVDEVRGRRMRVGARWHLQTRLPVEVDGGTIRVLGEPALTLHLPPEAGPVEVGEWEHDGPLRSLSWGLVHDRVNVCHGMVLTFGSPAIRRHRAEEVLRVEIDGEGFDFADPDDAGATLEAGER
ncbi:MAG: hypothetical protein EA425_16605 [Puniceicoccaceae bacterium]|nr:MAG: hypothetical protein EA425_16605 [Puniceicoccaceae bacterium]